MAERKDRLTIEDLVGIVGKSLAIESNPITKRSKELSIVNEIDDKGVINSYYKVEVADVSDDYISTDLVKILSYYNQFAI